MNWTKTGYISVLTTIAAASVGTWLYWRADNYVKPVDIAELMNGIIERQRVLITATSATVETNIVVSTNWQVQAGYTYQFLTTNGTYITSNYLELAVSTNVVVWTNVTDTMPVTPLECVVTATVTVGRYIDSITTNPAGDVYTNDAFATETEIRTNALTGYIVSADHIGLMQDAIRELAPYYVDGSLITNELASFDVLYSVSNLFGSLDIGNQTNEFTSIPGTGTNSAIYGNVTNHIYTNTIVEMYRAINALRYTLKTGTNVFYKSQQQYSYYIKSSDYTDNTWADAKAGAEAGTASNFSTTNYPPQAYTQGSVTNGSYWAIILRCQNSIACAIDTNSFEMPAVQGWYGFAYIGTENTNRVFDNNGEIPHTTNGVYARLDINIASTQGFYLISEAIGSLTNTAPNWCADPSGNPGAFFTRGYSLTEPRVVLDYNDTFTYCTNSL